MSKITIAIDGPAGSGKSTLAKMVAERLGFIYLDTGAMYRAITHLALKKGIVDDEDAVSKFVIGLNVSLKFEHNITRVFVNDEELTDYIRTPEVNAKVSEISRMPAVRNELVRMQQQMGNKGNIVAEGRDTTTVVFPDAELKIYMTASLEVRAERRRLELQEKGVEVNIKEVIENLSKRDQIDSSRQDSPLKKADGAIEVDTSHLTFDEQVNKILVLVEELIG